MTSSGDDLKLSPSDDGCQTIEGILVDGERLFLFDSNRLEEETHLESDCYVTIEEVR